MADLVETPGEVGAGLGDRGDEKARERIVDALRGPGDPLVGLLQRGGKGCDVLDRQPGNSPIAESAPAPTSATSRPAAASASTTRMLRPGTGTRPSSLGMGHRMAASA